MEMLRGLGVLAILSLTSDLMRSHRTRVVLVFVQYAEAHHRSPPYAHPV